MIRAAIFASCAITLTLFAPQRATAWCQMTTVAPPLGVACVTEGVPLSWRTGCMAIAVDVRGGNTLSAEQIEAVADRSFSAWMAVSCDGGTTGLDVRRWEANSTCRVAEYNGSNGNVNTIAMISSAAEWDALEYDPIAFAITTVWHNVDTGRILDVDMLVNEGLGPYVNCPATGCLPSQQDSVDLENVMTHEAGHFFGIGHSEIENATMFLEAGRGETIKRTLEPDDREALCSVYPPGLLSSCDDHTPRGGLDLNCEDEPEGSGSSCSVGRESNAGALPAWWLLVALLGGLSSRIRRVRRANA